VAKRGQGKGSPILLFDRCPSFRPDLRAASAVARSGCQGWPVFGPPRQRRAASLTAASTAACSIVSGPRSPTPPREGCLRFASDGRTDSALLLHAEDELSRHLAAPFFKPTLQRSQLAVGIDARVLML
jgi:hypothetical protein